MPADVRDTGPRAADDVNQPSPQREPPAAIVTGGSVGIGRSICEHLLQAGYEVVSLSRRDIDIADPRLHSVSVDLADVEATRAAAADVCGRFRVTTVVHNAGVMRPALLPDVKVEDLHALTDIHLSAALILVQAALPAMTAARFGRIVLVGSRAALGLATRTAYSATKAGISGLARTWALELGPTGITVNV
ncbi:MAG TPA: SDR family NAD(P)-dependent oxidoreductase, partial [Burkholderiaceae bacterium]|nr:SDR family NAD(P)-dependent oxidoreductase [Burkholderiaceae bacterium]